MKLRSLSMGVALAIGFSASGNAVAEENAPSTVKISAAIRGVTADPEVQKVLKCLADDLVDLARISSTRVARSLSGTDKKCFADVTIFCSELVNLASEQSHGLSQSDLEGRIMNLMTHYGHLLPVIQAVYAIEAQNVVRSSATKGLDKTVVGVAQRVCAALQEGVNRAK